MPSTAVGRGHSGSAEASVCITKASAGGKGAVCSLLSEGGGPVSPRSANRSISSRMLKDSMLGSSTDLPAVCQHSHHPLRTEAGASMRR